MTTPEYKLNDGGVLVMDQRELDYLSNFLEAGDRGGFYLGYYNMTGSEQAFEQAQVSTFSEYKGGIAYSSNALLQGAFSHYQGIYFISQQVAEAANTVIRREHAGPADSFEDRIRKRSGVLHVGVNSWER